MPNTKIIKTEESNYHIEGRGIPKGCQQCLKGLKSVLFLNGICQKPDKCAWYCPISEERRNKNITYINEIRISNDEDVLEELKKSDSKGMSITGGEPLFRKNIQKTIKYIKLIKNEFNNDFHIHLYTNGIDFNNDIANDLSEAGLDEIRFHPPKNKWANINLAINKNITVGAELPLIPDQKNLTKIKEFISYLDQIGAEFINLNEFEYCFPNSESLKEKGYSLKHGTIASVNQSRERAYELLEQMSSEVSLKMHFCSIRAKDYFQLKNRYYRRAQNIKLPFEEITDEGLLLYGQIEGHKPKLKRLFHELKYESKIPSKFLRFKENIINLPYYILIDQDFLDFFTQFNLEGYIIETLPFRIKKYRHITEKTPLKVFLNELNKDEN